MKKRIGTIIRLMLTATALLHARPADTPSAVSEPRLTGSSVKTIDAVRDFAVVVGTITELKPPTAQTEGMLRNAATVQVKTVLHVAGDLKLYTQFVIAPDKSLPMDINYFPKNGEEAPKPDTLYIFCISLWQVNRLEFLAARKILPATTEKLSQVQKLLSAKALH